ncbi:MAG: restriction endonuclease subunit S [Candidatus Binatia bacterium]
MTNRAGHVRQAQVRPRCERRWRRVQIDETYLGLYDGPHATPPPSEDGPVFLGIGNLTDDGHLDLREVRHIAEKDFARWTKRVTPSPGDIVFTYEATLNRYAIIPDGFRGCLGRRLALIRPNPEAVDTRFLHYSFFGEDWRQTIGKNTLSGATVDRIPLTTFPTFELSLPPLNEQRRIASILSAYDDLIENNTRRIAILEEMARALYREWFVYFRFPGHEKVRMVESPLGRIPMEWGVASLDTIKAKEPYAINGGPFGSKLGTKDYVPGGVPVIRGTNLSESGRFRANNFAFVSQEKAVELRANLARAGDIVVTQRGTLGQIAMIPSGIGFDSFVISQSQMKITVDARKVNREYVFFFLRSAETSQRIRNLASSSGVPHINLAVLREFQVLLPPHELQVEFGDFANSTETAIETLTREIDNLRTTRDLLLPKLISGEIDVSRLPYEPAAELHGEAS